MKVHFSYSWMIILGSSTHLCCCELWLNILCYLNRVFFIQHQFLWTAIISSNCSNNKAIFWVFLKDIIAYICKWRFPFVFSWYHNLFYFSLWSCYLIIRFWMARNAGVWTFGHTIQEALHHELVLNFLPYQLFDCLMLNASF